MTAPLKLAMLTDDAALFSLEHQLHLTDLVGEHSWSADLEVPALHFTGGTTLTCSAVHLLGTAAPGPQSWLWAWANPGAFPAGVTAIADQVRAFGEHYGIEPLRAPEVPFTSLPLGKQNALGAVAVFTDAAKAITSRWTSYNGDAGGGTRVAFLIEHADFVLGPPDPARVLRVFTQGFEQCPISDARRAVHSYAVQRQLGISWHPDGSSATITGPGLQIVSTFDRLGRLANLSATAGN